MFRSIPVIIALLGEVGVSGVRAKVYAPVLQEVGVKHNLDPATIISLVTGEASWNPSLVNPLGCVGLGQHCVKSIYPYCKPASPKYNRAQCDSKIAQLKNPIYNLRSIGRSITTARKWCNEYTNKRTKKSRSKWRHWMPQYGGYAGVPDSLGRKANVSKKHGVWCGQEYVCTKRKGKRCLKRSWRNVPIPKRIRQYMARRRKIINAVSKKRRKRRSR